jgi:hypothetical protein
VGVVATLDPGSRDVDATLSCCHACTASVVARTFI